MFDEIFWFCLASGTETLAIPQSDGSYKLYGYKWFTSATDSNIALTLARITDHNGESIQVCVGCIMIDYFARVRIILLNLGYCDDSNGFSLAIHSLLRTLITDSYINRCTLFSTS